MFDFNCLFVTNSLSTLALVLKTNALYRLAGGLIRIHTETETEPGGDTVAFRFCYSQSDKAGRVTRTKRIMYCHGSACHDHDKIDEIKGRVTKISDVVCLLRAR